MASMSLFKKLSTGAGMVLLLLAPFSSSFAQETSESPGASVSEVSSEPTLDAETSIAFENPPIETVFTDAPLAQDAATAETLIPSENLGEVAGQGVTTQETIPSDTLVQTENPSSTEGGVPLDDNTELDVVDLPEITPEETATTTPIIPDETQVEGVPVVPEEEIVPTDIPPEAVVEELPMEDISPKDGFKFSIKNGRIPTTEAPDWKVGDEIIDKYGKTTEVDKTEDITNIPKLSVNSVTNTLKVSGSCSMKYFVVLLYKNETDYNNDPAASILNRAFPCVGGKYSYSIDELPTTIPNGTYYLLVGEMGDTGTWTPITALVPISIAALE